MIEVREDWCNTLNRRGVRPPRLKQENECNYCRLCELICPDLAIIVIPDEEDDKKPVKKTLLTPVGGKIK
jgi:NAD-dependent dihydropyrimidine dehydrogenase PreA subunit